LASRARSGSLASRPYRWFIWLLAGALFRWLNAARIIARGDLHSGRSSNDLIFSRPLERKMSVPLPDPNLIQAHEALGAYFAAYSKVDHEVGKMVKVVLGLHGNQAGDAIVAALGDISRKANLVLAASQTAKQTDGKDASAEWKDSVEKQIKRAFECNNKRVPFAHSLLEPQPDGSVRLAQLKLDRGSLKEIAKNWTRDELLSEVDKMAVLGAELRELTAELSHFHYTIKLETGFYSTEFFTPVATTHSN
jgi:hypothetical protein